MLVYHLSLMCEYWGPESQNTCELADPNEWSISTLLKIIIYSNVLIFSMVGFHQDIFIQVYNKLGSYSFILFLLELTLTLQNNTYIHICLCLYIYNIYLAQSQKKMTRHYELEEICFVFLLVFVRRHGRYSTWQPVLI